MKGNPKPCRCQKLFVEDTTVRYRMGLGTVPTVPLCRRGEVAERLKAPVC